VRLTHLFKKTFTFSDIYYYKEFWQQEYIAMIIAEHCDMIKTSINRTQEALPFNHKGLYCEFQIVNYLKEAIFIVEHNNQATKIASEIGSFEYPCVKIEYRSVFGKRIRDDVNGLDVTMGTTKVLKIPLSVLRDHPVFIETLNIIISIDGFVDPVNHPSSKAYRDSQERFVQETLSNVVKNAPFTVVANDPTKTIQNLYFKFNGIICAAKVSNFIEEPDDIFICHRDLRLQSSDFHIVNTSFRELYKTDPYVWTVEGCTFSSNRVMLEKHLELVEVKRRDDVVTIEEHLRQIGLVKELGEIERTRMTSEITSLNKRLKTQTNLLEDLKNVSYSDNISLIELERISLEQEKLKHTKETLEREKEQMSLKMTHERQKHEQALKEERAKYRKEIMTSIATGFKTAAVVIPIAFSFYKLVTTVKE